MSTYTAIRQTLVTQFDVPPAKLEPTTRLAELRLGERELRALRDAVASRLAVVLATRDLGADTTLDEVARLVIAARQRTHAAAQYRR